MLEEIPKKNTNWKSIFITVFILLLVAAIAGVGWYAYRREMDYQRVIQEKNDPVALQQSQERQAQEIVDGLKTVLLIEDEANQPAVATVTDPEKLRESQPEFYKNAEEGDYLIVYPNRAIIFRSSQKKIINIAPIIQPPQVEGQSQEQNTNDATEPVSQANTNSTSNNSTRTNSTNSTNRR